jgi:hypothetical protein
VAFHLVEEIRANAIEQTIIARRLAAERHDPHQAMAQKWEDLKRDDDLARAGVCWG